MPSFSWPTREVHVWWLHLTVPPATLTRLAATLSSDEQEKAAAMHFDVHRNRYIAGRGLLRSILSSYLAQAPEALAFDYGPQGKPALAQEDLQFNLSHSGDLGLLGVTDLQAIGVDLEIVRPMKDLRAVAQRFFAPGEVSRLLALPEGEQVPAFFRCWTRKEAFIKALGSGLSTPLDSFEVAFTGDEPARLLYVADDVAAATLWSLRGLEAGPGATAALAVHGHDWQLVDCGSAPRQSS